MNLMQSKQPSYADTNMIYTIYLNSYLKSKIHDIIFIYVQMPRKCLSFSHYSVLNMCTNLCASLCGVKWSKTHFRDVICPEKFSLGQRM